MSVPQDAADVREVRELALFAWPPAALAQVRSVTVRGDRAEAMLQVNGDHEYWDYFVRFDGAWHPTVGGNGPTWGWDDASVIEW